MQSGSQEFKRYARLVVGWWWMFVLCAAVSVVAAYYVTKATTLEYTSRVQVLVESSQQPGTPSQTELVASESLAENYTHLITLGPTMQSVAANLPGDTYSPGALKRKITTTSLRNTITISVTDPDPAVAATIANITAETFIAGLLDRQLSQLARFEEVLVDYGIDPDPELIATRAAGLDILSVVEPAGPAKLPSNDYLLRNVGIAATLGLMVAGLGVFLIAYLDDRIRTTDDLNAMAGVVSLGSIPRFRSGDGPAISSLGGDRRLGHLAESYRFLWTNLGFATRDAQELKTLLVTSPGVSEGKTATAANLAISVANQGKSVILVDVNLHSPSLHNIFGVEKGGSLAQLLTGGATLEEALASTSIEGLQVIAGGGPDQELDTVFPPREMNRTIDELRERADLVIFDSPSLLAVSNAIALASMVEAVLLVVDSSRTGRDSVRHAIEALSQANAHVLGAVLNRVRGKKLTEQYLRRYLKNIEPRRSRRAVWLPSLPIVSGLLLGSILLGLGLAWLAMGFPGIGI